jgi:hypothetical protein
MSTTTLTRRLPVGLTRQADNRYRRPCTALASYRSDTGRVLAIYCPTCRRWVKPARYQPTTGTCRRCGRNRHHTTE